MSERFGTWQLEALIAVGGLGEVWLAFRDEAAVALKRLHTHLARNDEALAQFTLEQRLATELPPHPNVVHAEEVGTVGGRPYAALTLAPGEDLRALLGGSAHGSAGPTGEPMPRARVRAIAIAACEAAAHLHRHGFVHGDINPGNLVVDRTDHVTLVDLGIARAIGQAGPVRGTHAYMAPEQIRGEAWTCATDVFALGVVLWELTAGTRLFHRGPPWLSMAAVMEAEVPALPDPELDAIARSALVRDPGLRLPSATLLAARLRAL